MLLFQVIMATIILFVPGITAEKARQSAWMVPLVASTAGFGMLWVSWKLGKRFPRLTLIEYCPIILGRVFGKLVGFIYILFFIIFNLLVIREFTAFMKIALLPNTPVYVLNLVLLFVAGYAALKGLEVITRVNQFVLPLFLLSLLILFGLAIGEMDLERLLPLMEGGIPPIIKASLAPASWYGETVILLFILPYINKQEEIKIKGVWTLLAIAALLSTTTLITLAVLGPDLPGLLLFPFWHLSRLLEFGRSMLRMETIIVALWITGIVVKVALIHYLTCLITTQTFGLKSYKSSFLPTAFTVFIGATFIFSNPLQLAKFLAIVWPPIALLIELGIPVFLLIIAVLRKKQGDLSS